jgi:thioesterase domain-containing protein
VAFIFQHVNCVRPSELGLTAEALEHWADLAFPMQHIATDYEPSGSVLNMDVLYCDPLISVAANKQEWLEHRLSRWTEFIWTESRFHEVNGSHYTMLASEHVSTFQKTLKRVLVERGL